MLNEERWTANDETQFSEAGARRARVQAQRRDALLDVIKTMGLEYALHDAVVDSLIENATEMREALKPYERTVEAPPEDGGGK